MKHFTEITHQDLANLEVQVIKDNRSVEYLNIPSGFDIETTSLYVDDEKQAFMYVWALGIGDLLYYGREWEDLLYLLEFMRDHFQLHEKKLLPIYVHNLGYEFQFMRRWFSFTSVFAIDDRKPIKAITDLGIEFRDSLILSGSSLAFTARSLSSDIEKLEGDLDYSLIRTPNTPITPKEWEYIENDVLIILYYIQEQMEQYGDITKIPITNTSRVRDYVRNRVYYTDNDHKKTNAGKYNRYRELMKNLSLDEESYLQLKQGFMGGFTHANAYYSGKILENVSSIDFTSSYPSVMITEKYPMSKPIPVEVENVDQLEDLMKTKAVLMDIKFTNIESKIPQDNYISESKCVILENPLLNNGRVYSADTLAMTITDVDYQILKQAYKWDHLAVKNVKVFHKDYLPKDVILSILDLFKDKTELQGLEDMQQEYDLSKAMLNSVYGMSVTDIVKDDHVYNDELDEWDLEPVDIADEIEKHNNSKNRFLYYAWGVWVTAYARFNLWSGILAIGEDYVYSDTDSIKFLNMEDHEEYIKYYDDLLYKRQKEMCDYYDIPYSKLSPKTKDGTPVYLGAWDYEGTYERFKTLGAKRYLEEENGKLEMTVAGVSKTEGLEYMLEMCYNDNRKVFDMFNDNLFIPAHRSGKNTHTYIDRENSFIVEDYLGDEMEITSKSGIHLEEVAFTLSVSKNYQNFIENYLDGFIFGGVKLE